jgi:hypothetical protein
MFATIRTEILRFCGYAAVLLFFRGFFGTLILADVNTAEGTLRTDTAIGGLCFVILLGWGLWRLAVLAVAALKRA